MAAVNKSEEHAMSTLRAQGFDVDPIPRGETKSADLRVSDSEFSYLVEVTGREEPQFVRDLLAAAHQKGLATGTRPVTRSNRLDGIVNAKAQQLEQTPVSADFHVLWIAAFHGDWEFLGQLLTRTLYGFETLFTFESMRSEPVARECIYYNHFSFYRNRNLQAVVLSTREKGCLYVNALSPRAAEFRRSRFYDMLGERARIDPSEQPSDVLVVAPEVDRSQRNAAWRYIKDHYGLMSSVAHFVDFRGVASLRAGEGSPSCNECEPS